MAAEEGVIKFVARHAMRPLAADAAERACALVAWRTLLAQIGVIGQDPRRYDGAGFGNVSGRLPPWPGERGARRFLVSGTQTGGAACLGPEHFCVVERWDVARNEVASAGPILPSSEAMTHGAIYDLAPAIRFVFHGHCPVLWQAAAGLRLPTTRPDVAYGTPDMAREVGRLFRDGSLADLRILAMGGHQDGVIVFGRTADEAGQVLLSHLARAYTDVCRRDARVCARE